MKASIDTAYYSFDRGSYMARVIRGASLYEYTESLPPLSKRGKHTKCTSALDDEEVREQCLSYFQSLPPNARSATKLKANYEQVVYPEVSGSMNKATISLTTITRYLQLWGFSLKGHTKDIYYDGHERTDVVDYRKSWAATMMDYRTKMREYGGEDCSEVIMPDLQDGDKEVVLVTHDECYFNSNDDVTITWTEKGESTIKKNGQGLGLISDFYCACHGSLRFDDQYAREIIEPGRIVTASGFPMTWYNNLKGPWKSSKNYTPSAWAGCQDHGATHAP
ncbi:hypothetical protein POJ06DRAFT_237718 [Lipomyces tetrasporus]|uniref:Uncharacterized protein n=1 Tax=Lipomyces tetrasporus TaxID=54092 RepID=A0AAD7QU86_9ASCO|nr:uncharacterized protein POJ06DRAFT_237718 [Lipomyces tetrasporus]KAJ8101608.1 hypothetical protein POJ06DRAFT_237718 [Lipomyces tetrasporus]